MFKNPGSNCDVGATDEGEGEFGFVVMNLPGQPGGPPPREFSATISLKGADPDTTYVIGLFQHPGDCPFTAPDEEFLTTNEVGNGTIHATEEWVPTATKFIVLAEGISGPGVGQRYISLAVVLN